MRRNRRSTTVQPSPEDLEREFQTIRQALLQNMDTIVEAIQRKFSSPKPWKFLKAGHALPETGDVIDLVFEHSAPEDKRFVIVDICVPYLGRGQKYTLDVKGRQFQKEQEVAVTRIKKALLMMKRPGETLAPPPAKLSSKIIELTIPTLAAPAAAPAAPASPSKPAAPAAQPPVEQKKPAAPAFTPELLEALKRTIVHECLGTMYKRRNKYIRKGLWRWIEREIMDPNVHFFLIILSSIYQGKTSDVLSRQFKNIEEYTNGAEKVIEALFSNETGLAPEILKSSERHKQGLRKFLACFYQTPPFEYLRTLFLKEFRTTRDSNRARIAVFDTLKELLTRCGFEGEKEVQYPLEILDELSIFPGFIMGNYAQLRVENAAKKLQKLVPEHSWSSAEIYRLRDELARTLGLPPEEFNLNAFLPQAFLRDNVPAPTAQPQGAAAPGPMPAATGRPQGQQGMRPQRDRQPQPSQRRPEPVQEPATPPLEDAGQPALPFEAPAEPPASVEPPRQTLPQRPPRGPYRNTADLPVQTSISQSQEQAATPALPTEATAMPVPEAGLKPQPQPQRQLPPQGQRPAGSQGPQQRPPQQQQQQQQRPPSQGFNRSPELDEARHRYFENFGGHPTEDPEAIRFMLEMERVVADAARAPVRAPEPEMGNPFDDRPPSKNGRPPVRQQSQQGMPREPRRPQNPQMAGQNQGDPNRRRRGKRRHHRSGNRPPMPRMPQ
ncbi:MAG TPA: hypothetical protein PLP29_09365 [Candidatus Ozemobacteraceae bacterium]|nr:hypothetical protein [Candidatus Ozemobacteraceae bacterium]